MSSPHRALAAMIVIVGLLALAAGAVYLVVEARSLPSFMGRIAGDPAHRSLRGIVALIAGVLLVAGGAGLLAYPPGRRR